MNDDKFLKQSAKLMKFEAERPEMEEELGLWMADKGTCEEVYPEAAAIFKKELPGF